MFTHGKIIEQTIWGEKANSTQYLLHSTLQFEEKNRNTILLSASISFRNGDIVLNNTSASRIA
jgi:hypothetical protein